MSWVWKFLKIATFVLVGSPAPQPAADRVVAQIERADAIQMTGQFAQADKELQKALVLSQSKAEAHKWQPDIYFRRGYLNQQWADRLEGPEREDKLEVAIAAYEAVPPEDEKYGPSRNNLGNVYLQMESPEAKQAALEYFREAASSDHEMSPVFWLNLAQALEEVGDSQEAEEVYRRILESDPYVEDAQERLLHLYLAAGPTATEKALDLCKRLIDWRNVGLAISGLKRILGNTTDVPIESREQALLLLVESYAALELTPVSYSSEKRFLDHVESLNPPFRAGIAEIRKALKWSDEPPGIQEAVHQIHWWRETDHRQKEFSQMLKTLGDWSYYERRNAPALAYYRTAAKLDQANMEAYLALASGLISTEPVDRDPSILGSVFSEIYDSELHAYTSSDWTNIERFHNLLGMTFARQERWGSSSDPTSAIFHLEHALTAARKADAENKRVGRPILPQSPEILKLLAQAYQVTGREKDAWDRFVEAVEAALEVHDLETAESALEGARLVSDSVGPKAQERMRVLEDLLRKKRESNPPVDK